MASRSIYQKFLAGAACLCLSLAGCAAPGMSGPSPWRGNSFGWHKKDDRASPTLQVAWARIQENDGNLPEARKAYLKALDKDPKFLDAMLGLARLDYLAHRVDEAEQGFQKAVKVAPDSPLAVTALGEFYADQQRWDEAIDAMRQAMDLSPDDRNCRHQMAIVLAKAGRTEEALMYFNQSVGPAEAHYNVGRVLYDQGKIPLAEEQFVLAVMKNPKLDEAQYWLDEVRRERDAQLVLSPQRAPGAVVPAGQVAAPAQRGAPVVTPAAGVAPSTVIPQQSGAQIRVTAAPSATTATAMTTMSSASAPAPIIATSPVPGTVPVPNTAPSSAAWPTQTAASSEFTPQQLEQMRNQRNSQP